MADVWNCLTVCRLPPYNWRWWCRWRGHMYPLPLPSTTTTSSSSIHSAGAVTTVLSTVGKWNKCLLPIHHNQWNSEHYTSCVVNREKTNMAIMVWVQIPNKKKIKWITNWRKTHYSNISGKSNINSVHTQFNHTLFPNIIYNLSNSCFKLLMLRPQNCSYLVTRTLPFRLAPE